MSNIVNSAWLAERIMNKGINNSAITSLHHNPDSEFKLGSEAYSDLIVVDCRFVLGQPNAGREAYTAGHIPEAVYMDLEQDLSGVKKEHGGRHPLPDLGAFALKLGKLGMDEKVSIVAYDDQGGAMAARFWWMLHFLGHAKVHILDGGFAQWKAAGYEVSEMSPTHVEPRTFKPNVNRHLLLSIDEVKQKLGQDNTILIDSREKPRYLGLEEPIDAVAGHIPGAINAFWKESLNGDGLWKNAEEQRERFADIQPDKELIVYCGSGVTACPNFVALKEAGFNNVKLYSGSWSDWISYVDNPIAKGEE